MGKAYTEQEKSEILGELNIQLINGKLSSDQVAKIWTKRAEIELGVHHEYDDNSVRWRVKGKSLNTAGKLHKRMNLFNIDDAFTAKLHPGKGPKEIKKQGDGSVRRAVRGKKG